MPSVTRGAEVRTHFVATTPATLGTVDETRTHTPFGTAPSRQRVYQFHHDGTTKPMDYNDVPYERWAPRLKIVLITFYRPLQPPEQQEPEQRQAQGPPRYLSPAQARVPSYQGQPGPAHQLVHR